MVYCGRAGAGFADGGAAAGGGSVIILTGGIEAALGKSIGLVTGAPDSVAADGCKGSPEPTGGAAATGADAGAIQFAAWRAMLFSSVRSLRWAFTVLASPKSAKVVQLSAVQPSRCASTWATKP